MKRVLLAAAFVVVASSARAAAPPKEWQIDYTKSFLGFVGDQGGEKFPGGFGKYVATVRLDPDHPETGQIDVVVDTSSAYAEGKDREAMLPKKDWFDIAHFPQAIFKSKAIKKTGEHSYVADGPLIIKGLSADISLPFTLEKEGDHWHAQGRVTLQRNEYAVGMGQFTTEDFVKFPVDVVVDLVAKPVL
jgi:polyisoprenoid-binding protein YceI